MKTAELIGMELDYWVAKAEGLVVVMPMREHSPVGCDDVPCYSKFWDKSGPIIEREGIWIEKITTGRWKAVTFAVVQSGDTTPYLWPSGETALIAAMRAYVASVYGDEVEDL